MKFLLSILTGLLTSLTLWAAPTLPPAFYAKQSVLNTGNWVKIAVDDTGIYEVSYQTLKSMGFSDPERVGVYGRGGRMLPMDFVDMSGKLNISDDLAPVAVLHLNDKIYFYAEGVDNQTFTDSSSLSVKGYYQRDSKNIYTRKGYYFLSDVEPPLLMDVRSIEDSTASGTTSTGFGKISHELDLVHNMSNTGQLYFGEKLTGENARIEWPLSLPGCIPYQTGVMECSFYVDRDVTGHLSYGVTNTDDNISFDTKTYASTVMRDQEPRYGEVKVTGESTTLFVEFRTSDKVDIAHLDYWTLTYPRYLPTLRDSKGERLNQEFICFPSIPRNRTWAATFTNAGSMCILDISSPSRPVVLDGELRGSSKTVHITNNTGIAELMVFDPMLPQKQISGYDTTHSFISNQNLHALAADGVDLIIICIPALRDRAMRLAEIHEKYEGIKVAVATSEEVYNEFSQGIPDPMAYRSFVKAAYSSEHPVKNLLLLGPLVADVRGIRTERNPEESIIAYQLHPMNQLRGSQNANDYYGMMADVLDVTIEKNIMHVGVGILPCRFAVEADIIIDKIEKYLSRTDFAYYSNKFLNVGGTGDNHTHDIQARSYGGLINQVDLGSSIVTPLIVDAYGYDEAHDKFFDVIEDGSMVINYFGHGSPRLLNRAGNFFTINDVYKLRNTFHPFIGFAGCEISNCDRGVRGLGEALVTATPNGVIGTLLATRETWSGQNYDLFQTFMINLFCEGSTAPAPLRTHNTTIGEIYARTKTRSSYNNELAYQLVCDPAITLPIITRAVVLDRDRYMGVPGEYNTISGYISTHSLTDDIDTDFNGEIVLRLMEPYQSLTSQDLCTGGTEETTQTIDIIYADTQVAMTTAKVENGRFTAEIFIPNSMSEYAHRIGRLHSCAFDPESRLIAASMYAVTFLEKEKETSQDKDNVPPVIDIMEYDPDMNVIRIEAHDDMALSFSRQPLARSIELKIDGMLYQTALRHEATVSNDGRSFSKDVPLNDIVEGSHNALLTVTDVAGNTATREITFTYNPSRARLTIGLMETAVNDCATIRMENDTNMTADIIIIDAGANVIYRGAFTNGEFIWDVCDSDGNRVTPGLYKAYILETGDYPDKRHSNTIDIPVI